MLSRDEFVEVSLEINLFFQRIMKEHMFFVEVSLMPVEPGYINEAKTLKQNFENLLAKTVQLAKGVNLDYAIKSNELVTPYTLRAEEISSKLTGASINTKITMAEQQLRGNNFTYDSYGELYNELQALNTQSLNMLKKVIAFLKNILAKVSECSLFINLYNELIKHLIRESEYYLEYLTSLQNGGLPNKTLCQQLNFWNNIMSEHSEFIDGLLDPTEKALKEVAQNYANMFEMLEGKCNRTDANQIIQESIDAAEGIKKFKTDATVGLLECKIKSIILPLLADHVLREANYYLRLLE